MALTNDKDDLQSDSEQGRNVKEIGPLLWLPSVRQQFQGPRAINLKSVFPFINLEFAALGKLALMKASQLPGC